MLSQDPCSVSRVVASSPARPRKRGTLRRLGRLSCRAGVGIDLGTTNSLVAVVQDGKPVVIAGGNGSFLLPSVVRYAASGLEVGLTGESEQDPVNTFYCVKRLIGRSFDEVETLTSSLSYGLTSGEGNKALLRCPAAPQGTISPEEVSSEIIKVLKTRAEQYLQTSVDRAVITVPAHFSAAQRLATMSAAMLAGIERVSLLKEPVAAAMAYGLGKPHDEQPAILVFDLGGGTFDVSLLHSFEGIMEVVASDGNNLLGGFDLDTAIVDYVLKEMLTEEQAQQVRANPVAFEQLRQAAEQAKIALSTSDSAEMNFGAIPSISTLQSTCLTSKNLQQIAEPFLERLWAPLKALGDEYKVAYAWRPDGSPSPAAMRMDRFAPPPRALTQLVLVGGATKAPMIRDFAERVAGVRACSGVDPEHCVALGAAIQVGMMDGSLPEGLEMMDSIYVQALQGRVSGFQM